MRSFTPGLLLILNLSLILQFSSSGLYAQESMFAEPLTDIDGNTYSTITIGKQTWMAENLRATHYSNSDAIQLISKKGDWKRLSTVSKAYCWLNDDKITNAESYGALYSWAAAMNGSDGSTNNPSNVQGICPTGWHLPSDSEWKELEMHIGMIETDADGVKERGANEGSKLAGNKSLWNSGSLTKDLQFGITGFNAVPGSYRYDFGSFFSRGYYSCWWTATDFNPNFAWYRSISYGYSTMYRYTISKEYGFAVRCVKDE